MNESASDALRRPATIEPGGFPGRSGSSRREARERTSASPEALDHLTRELTSIGGPDQRATPGVRASARRVAREMLATGATASDVRDVLTRIVGELQERSRSADGNAGPQHDRTLLADVLQCASGVDTPREVSVVDERRSS